MMLKISREQVSWNSSDLFSSVPQDHPFDLGLMKRFATDLGAREFPMYPNMPNNKKSYFDFNGSNLGHYPPFEGKAFLSIMTYLSILYKVQFSAEGYQAFQIIQNLVGLAGGSKFFAQTNLGSMTDKRVDDFQIKFDGKSLSLSAGAMNGRIVGQGGHVIEKIKSWFSCRVEVV